MRRPLGGGSVRISDLSRQTGVPTATIKFYLREHLLPPGAMTARNQADYGSEHLRRVWVVLGGAPPRRVGLAPRPATLSWGARPPLFPGAPSRRVPPAPGRAGTGCAALHR